MFEHLVRLLMMDIIVLGHNLQIVSFQTWHCATKFVVDKDEIDNLYRSQSYNLGVGDFHSSISLHLMLQGAV
jgi:hypothetical protein